MMVADDDEWDSGSLRDVRERRKWPRYLVIGVAVVLVVCAVLILIVGVANSKDGPVKPDQPNQETENLWNSTRLPSWAKPIHYDLKVETNFEDFVFTVQQNIQVEVTTDFYKSRALVLHTFGLNITSPKLKRTVGQLETLEPEKVLYNNVYEYVYFVFADKDLETLEASDRVFNLTFEVRGVLNEFMNGFYRSSYIENNQTHWMAVTDFEPNRAHNAFVCFDEPAMKATYTLSTVVDTSQGWVALSNMPVESQVPLGNGKEEVRFERSVKMSTYLVCFIISKFVSVDGYSGNTTVKVWTTPATLSQAQYSLTVAESVLGHYERYFNVKYPLPKLDLIAIPDFNAGAMENWGLITFRQILLLYTPGVTSSAEKDRVVEVVAHEIAHQWFGNIVTMEWWDDLWLNEGFATYMSYIGIDAAEPEWKVWNSFPRLSRHDGLAADALLSSHPVLPNLTDVNEIMQQFDDISYEKGASIIRMLAFYLDAKDPTFFTRGLTHYLEAHAYGNARTHELWNSLALISGDANIPKIMDTWTLQMGYPYITVSIDTSANLLTLKQQRFLLVNDGQKHDELWWVPIRVHAVQSNRIVDANLPLVVGTSIPYNAAQDGVAIVNEEGAGFFRVHYEGAARDALVQLFNSNFSVLSVGTRAALVDDSFNFINSGLEKIGNALSLLQYLRDERELNVWSLALNHLYYYASLLREEPVYSSYENFIRFLVTPTAATVGWQVQTTESHDVSELRPLILNAAAIFGDVPTIQTAQQMFRNNFQVDGDLRNVIYDVVARNGGVAEYEEFLRRLAATNDISERERCMRALGKFSQHYLLKRTLLLTLNPSVIRVQDSFVVIYHVAGNVHGTQMAWDFFKENREQLVTMLGDGFNLKNLVQAVTSNFNSQIKLEEIRSYFEANPIPSISRGVAGTLETLQSRIDWLNLNLPDLQQWLAAFSSGGSVVPSA